LPQDLMVASRRDLEQFIERVALREDYDVGRSFVLPSTFRGSPEEMRTLREHMIRSVYVSAIRGDRPIVSLLQTFQIKGTPDLFVTMTSESFWPEMKDSPWIFQYDNTLNPDMTARIFANRIEHLRELIMVKKVFGHVTSFISVTEFQKRGLPHVHMLITLADKVYFSL
jgi:Helitron helicase-like domain at N-terminus